MATRVDPWLIWPRAFCVGGLAFGLGVVGHVMADGRLPGPTALAVLLAVSVLVSGPMLARPAGPIRLVSMLVGGQTFVHLVLTAAAGHRGDPASVGVGSATPHGLSPLPVVDGHRVGSLLDAYQGTSSQPSSMAPAVPIGHLLNDMSAHAPMMAAHLVAAALVGLWLARGERLLWSVLALTGRRVLAAVWGLVPPVSAGPAGPARPLGELRATPVSLWQARPGTRRGPPLLAC